MGDVACCMHKGAPSKAEFLERVAQSAEAFLSPVLKERTSASGSYILCEALYS